MTRKVRGAAVRRALAMFLGASVVLAPAAPLDAQKGPPPESTGLPPDVLALACAPTLAFELPAVPLRVTGGQGSVRRLSFAPGDLIAISAGTRNGISVGQEFYTRRPLVSSQQRVSRDNPATIRTTGWIRVYAVDDNLSLATITHSCDTVDVNDYLEPFSLPTVPAPAKAAGPAERDNYGRVLVGQDRRTAFGANDYLVIDRGSSHGVTPGARFVFYQERHLVDNFLFQLGEGVAVDVRAETATIRVMTAIDAILEGDYVALRK